MKNFACVRLTAVVLMAASFVVLVSSAGHSQATDEEHEKFFALMDQVMAAASAARGTPITDPGIPLEKVNGVWNISIFKLKGPAVVGTYVLAPQYKFYVQAWICDPKGFWDGTFLGEHETAETFYQANLSFMGSNSVDYIECMPTGASYESDVPAAKTDKIRYTSEERVLSYMANWVYFWANKNEAARTADFMRLTMTKYKQLLVAEDAKGDLKELAGRIKMFDSIFPFEVFDLDLHLGPEARTDARDFFQTMLLMRRKLKVISPASAEPIARDEALLNKLR
jgi:hypothetical protein